MDNTKKLQCIDNVVMYFGNITKKLAIVHGDSRIAGLPEISIATKNGINAINDVIDALTGLRDITLKEIGAVKVPVKNMDKPDLKLVVDNGPIEVNFKGIRPKNPLW